LLLVYARTLVRDEGDARELVQDALLAAWKNLKKFDVTRDRGGEVICFAILAFCGRDWWAGHGAIEGEARVPGPIGAALVLSRHICDECQQCPMERARELKRCSGCRAVYYCTRRGMDGKAVCQHKAWSGHKKACKRARKAAEARALAEQGEAEAEQAAKEADEIVRQAEEAEARAEAAKLAKAKKQAARKKAQKKRRKQKIRDADDEMTRKQEERERGGAAPL